MTRAAVGDWARRKAVALAATVVALAGCGGLGGGGSVDLTVAPGQSREDVLRIATDVEGGELLSCDFATVLPSEADTEAALRELDVELGSPRPDGRRSCAVPFVLTANDDASPGDYRVRVKLFYSYRGPLGFESATVEGDIRAGVVG